MVNLGASVSSTADGAALSDEKRAEIAVTALGNLDPQQQQEALKQAGVAPAVQDVETLSDAKKAGLAVTALGHLDPQQQQEALKRAGVAPAGQETSDKIWMWIVLSFAAVLVLAVVTIGIIALGLSRSTDNIQLMLTVFTTAAGFLAGLLSPSPLATGK